MAKISEALEIVNLINSDFSASNATKERMKKIIEILNNDSKDIGIRANACINDLEELINDPNIDSYIRTQLWSLISVLEIIEE